MTAPLIGLTGAAGAGKDASAAVLAAAGWRGIAFADALRIEAAEAWTIDIRLFADRAAKEAPHPHLALHYCARPAFSAWAQATGLDMRMPRSPRYVMQAWGTWRRQMNSQHWVQQVDAWVRYQRSTGARGLVVSDVRMPNEAAMVRSAGGHIVRVHRPDAPPLPADTATHESEQHRAIQADADIHNDGDLQHLQAEVWRVVQRLSLIANPNSTTGDLHV